MLKLSHRNVSNSSRNVLSGNAVVLISRADTAAAVASTLPTYSTDHTFTMDPPMSTYLLTFYYCNYCKLNRIRVHSGEPDKVELHSDPVESPSSPRLAAPTKNTLPSSATSRQCCPSWPTLQWTMRGDLTTVNSLHSAPAADDDALDEDVELLAPTAGDAVGVDFIPTH